MVFAESGPVGLPAVEQVEAVEGAQQVVEVAVV